MSRLKNWEKEKRYYLPRLGDDVEFQKIFDERFEKYNKNDEDEINDLYYSTLNNCVEIILTNNNKDGYTLHPIIRCIDAVTLEIVEGEVFIMYGFEDDDDLKRSIAFAMIKQVPIYGNNKTLQAKVDSLQEDIILNGFKENGKRYALTAYSDYDTSNHDNIIKKLNESSYITRAEIKILNNSVSNKFKEFTNASNFLHKIEHTINEFSSLLDSSVRNENTLQEFITHNPIILGTEYTLIIPKHKLGAEYEMDYALQRFDSVFDLVELESSNLQVFNKNGQPSHHLVHAEQQVLDWQEWLEEKNFYAREKLENISNPKGIVVIGRSQTTDLKKLRRRNISFGSNLVIYTYDQLLEKLKTLDKNIRSGKV